MPERSRVVPQGSNADTAEAGLNVENQFTQMDQATSFRLRAEAMAQEEELDGTADPDTLQDGKRQHGTQS